jgi:hypothetical protein
MMAALKSRCAPAARAPKHQNPHFYTRVDSCCCTFPLIRCRRCTNLTYISHPRPSPHVSLHARFPALDPCPLFYRLAELRRCRHVS